MKIIDLLLYYLISKFNRMNEENLDFLTDQIFEIVFIGRKIISSLFIFSYLSNLEEEINFFNAIETKDLCQIINFTLNKEKLHDFPSFFYRI